MNTVLKLEDIKQIREIQGAVELVLKHHTNGRQIERKEYGDRTAEVWSVMPDKSRVLLFTYDSVKLV